MSTRLGKRDAESTCAETRGQRNSRNTLFLLADVGYQTNVFTHWVSPFLCAGPLVPGLDGHSVTCSRGVQGGSELSWGAEVQRGFRRGGFGGHTDGRMRGRLTHRFNERKFGCE